MVGGSNPLTPTISSGTKSPRKTARRLKQPQNVNKNVNKFVNPIHPYREQLFRYLIHQLQRQLHISNATLARSIGISPAYLSYLKSGKRSLTPAILMNLEGYLSSLANPPALNFSDPFCVDTSVQGMIRIKDFHTSELIAQFLEAKEVEGRTRGTLAFYRDNLGRFLWWLKESGTGPEIKAVTTQKLRSFLAYVKNTKNRWRVGSTSSRGLPTMATVDAYWRTLQSFFAWLVKQEILNEKENPLRKIPRPKVAKKIVQDIPLKLIQCALDLWNQTTFIGARNRAIILILLDTGMRLAEISGIKVRDLSLDDAILTIWCKGQKQRKVRLGEYALNALANYLELRPRVSCQQLWLTGIGKPLSYSGIQSMVRRLSRLGGNVRWSPHTFRTTFAMSYLRAGGDPFTLQILGGWEDLEMPRHYTAALKVEDAFAVHRRVSPANQLRQLQTGQGETPADPT